MSGLIIGIPSILGRRDLLAKTKVATEAVMRLVYRKNTMPLRA
jgi:hypothetical protein